MRGGTNANLGTNKKFSAATASNITVASGEYRDLASTTVSEAGTYLITVGVGFNSYSNGGGWFLRCHLGTIGTYAFVSGLLASATGTLVQTLTAGQSISVGVAQFSGGSMDVNGSITAVKLIEGGGHKLSRLLRLLRRRGA